MNLRRIKHMLMRLSAEEKVAGIGALMVLAGAFLPWFSITFSSAEKGATVSGFAGDLGVIGFIVFLITAMALSFIMAEHLYIRLPHFGFKKEQIILFLMGESAFLLLLTVAIYTKRSFEYTNAEIRFGLYTALIGAFIGTMAIFSAVQKYQKKEINAFFSHEEEMESEEAINTDQESDFPEEEEKSYKSTLSARAKKIEEPLPPAEQKNFFYEEQEIAEEETLSDEEPLEEMTLENDEKNMEDENMEDKDLEINNDLEIAEEPLEEEGIADEEFQEELFETIEKKTETINENQSSSDQGAYFTREAGIENKTSIKVDLDSIHPIKKEENEKPVSQNMSFYDDL